MTNQEVNEFMQRFLDDDLNEEELESLMEHIRQSPASAALFERLQRLDSELELLPKVIPPMSIVDSILPRLELAGLIDHPPVTSTTSSEGLPNRVVPMERRSTIRERVNYRLLGGVVAAGVVLTLFFSNFGPQMSFDDNAEEAASSDQIVLDGNATLKRSDTQNNAPAQSPSTGDVQEKALDPNDQSDQMPTTLTEPLLPNSDSKKALSNDSAADKAWVDKGEASRAGVAENPVEPEVSGAAPDTPPAATSPVPNDSLAPKSDSPVVGEPATEPATEPAAEELEDDRVMYMKQPSPTVASPNEKLLGTVTAVTDQGQRIIITEQSGQQVYESALYNGDLNELTWSPDSTQLHFEVATEGNEPVVHMTIDLATLTETESIKVEE